MPSIEDRVQLWIVIHLHLTVETKAAAAGKNLRPKLIQAPGEIVALLDQHREPVAIALAMLFCSRLPMRLLGGVKDLQGQDGEAVDDQSGRLRVERGGCILLTREPQQVLIDLFDQIVALLVEAVDGVLDLGDRVVGGVRAAGVVLLVPKIEVGAMLGQDQGVQVLRRRDRERIMVPGVIGIVMRAQNGCGVDHRRHTHQPIKAVLCAGMRLARVQGSKHNEWMSGAAGGASSNTWPEVRRVLIYRMGSLGDTVVALPSLHLAASAFPNAERRMLTNFPVSSKAPAAAAVLGESGLVHGYLRYAVGTRNPLELLSLWWKLLRWRPEVLVYLGPARGISAARRDARFFRLCGISWQIGVPLTAGMQENLRQPETGALEPESERLARNLHELGDANIDTPAAWQMHLTPAEKDRAAQSLAAAAGRPVLAVSVGTKVQSKDWGKANWQALLRAVGEEHPEYALVLTGAREESETSEFAAAGWREAAGSASCVINLCGSLTPRESAAVFARAEVFAGHDSGPMHLAATVGTTCVAIFAARNIPRVWFPHGDRHRVLFHEVDCMGCGLETCIAQKKKCLTSITVAEVAVQVIGALRERALATRSSVGSL